MVALALALLALGADDLNPEKAAKVQKDRDTAMADIAKKYGNKKSTELSQDERREMIREQRAAENAVLEKNNVDPKEFARYEAKMSLSDRTATNNARALLDQKEVEAKKAAEQKAQPGNGEIPIQRGFSDSNPVTLEENNNSGGGIVVEKGLPPDAQNDQAEAAGMGTGSGGFDDSSSKKSGGKKK
ncbi:MAG: hypothetical protein JNK82_44795 [Myxococcaceae bacterium]|nr:hypothetical protein [Myxococcaceae bacterium]